MSASNENERREKERFPKSPPSLCLPFKSFIRNPLEKQARAAVFLFSLYSFSFHELFLLFATLSSQILSAVASIDNGHRERKPVSLIPFSIISDPFCSYKCVFFALLPVTRGTTPFPTKTHNVPRCSILMFHVPQGSSHHFLGMGLIALGLLSSLPPSSFFSCFRKYETTLLGFGT